MGFLKNAEYGRGVAESILLGHAPRPTDGAQLAKRIRTLVIAAEPAGIVQLHASLKSLTLRVSISRNGLKP